MADLRGGSTVGGRPILGKEARDNYIGKIVGNKVKESLIYDDGNKVTVKGNVLWIEGGNDNPHSIRLKRASSGSHSWEFKNESGHLYFMGGDDNASIERMRIDSSGYIHLGQQGTLTSHAVRADRAIKTGTGITGGGDLTADRTLSFDTTWGDARYLGATAKAVDSDKLDGNDGSFYDQRVYNSQSNYLGGGYISGGGEKPNWFGAGKLKLQMLSSSNIGGGDQWNDVLWMSAYTGGDVKGSSALVFSKYTDKVGFMRQNYDSTTWGTFREFWHTGNFDPNSKLGATSKAVDSDKLDGYDSSYFATATHGHAVADVTGLQGELDWRLSKDGSTAMTGGLTIDTTSDTALTMTARDANGFATNALSLKKHSVANDYEWALEFNTGGNPRLFHFKATTGSVMVNATGGFQWNGQSLDSRYLGSSSKAVDSDKLDGFDASMNNSADTVAVRNGSGDIFARLFRSEYTSATSNTSYFMVQHATGSGADNYLRPATMSQVVSNLRNNGLDSAYVTKSGDNTLTGRIVASNSNRQSGIYGTYDSYKIDHIWSMGTAYAIASDGSTFGNLYGLAYKHTNNTTGGTMAGSHQVVWVHNGSPRSAMGYDGLWGVGASIDGTITISASPPILELHPSVNSAGNEGRITFHNNAKDQSVNLRFNHYDTEKAPSGLHLERASGNTGGDPYLKVNGEIQGGTINVNGHKVITASYVGSPSYPALTVDGGSENGWIRTTNSGLIPNSNGTGSLGTSSWRFHDVWSHNMFFGQNSGTGKYVIMSGTSGAGSGTEGTEPTLRPNAAGYGFVGTSSYPFFRSYASSHVSTSRKKHKEDLQDTDTKTLKSLARSLGTKKYKYSFDDKSTDATETYLISNQKQVKADKIGIIIDEMEHLEDAQLILDEDMEGVDIYAYATMILGALQETMNEVDELREEITSLKANKI